MAENKHAVVRLDVMSGTKNGARIKSAKFYAEDAVAAIDNAQLVILGEKLGREIYKATAPTAESVRGDIYLVASVELMYDESRYHYLSEFTNEADRAIRVYDLVPGSDCFSATAEAFEGTPEEGKYVGFAADSTKLQIQDAADEKTIGKIVAKETAGFGKGLYTYYVIDVK